MAGQINVRLTATDDAEFDQWAAQLGIERGALGRRTVLEALAARREGRAMFEQPETLSPADLHRLIGEVAALRMELDRVLRQNAERDAALVRSARDDTTGISEARTAIVSQVAAALEGDLQQLLGAMTALSAKTDNPPAVARMHEDLRSLRAEIGKNQESDLIAARARQAEILRETGKRRALFMLIIDEKHWSTAWLMTWGLMTGIIGALILIPAASFFPSLAVPVAMQLLRDDHQVCRMLDQRYAAADCIVPQAHRRAAAGNPVPVPARPVHRARHR